MKRILCTVCALALLLTLCACGKKIDYFYPTPEDVTMESLKERTIPQNMLSIDGGFQIDWRNEDESYAGAHASTTSMRYRYDGEKVLINQVVDYDNGEYTHLYFTSDLKDPVMFIDDDRSGVSVTDLTDRDMQNSLTQSLFGLEYYNCEITERSKETDGSYRITYDARDASLENQVVQHVVMTVEPIRGVVTGAEIYFYDYGVEAGLSTVNIIYSRNVRIDDSPRTKAIEQGVYDPDQVNNQTETESRTGSFNFACTDLDGTLHSISDYTGSDYIIVGYWEPESPDCVDELAELQDLYADFGDTLTVLGVFSSEDEDAVRAAVKEAGATFPILKCDTRLALYRGETLPCAIVVDNQGELLTDEPYFGVLTYSDWTAILSSLQSAADSAEGEE